MLSPYTLCVALPLALLLTSPPGGLVGAGGPAYGPAGSYVAPGRGRCERITMPLCQTMKYNLTLMPNLVGHTSQKEAELQIHEFIPLIQLGCSKLLTFFLCSLYAPMCTEQVDDTMVIPACRSMCLDVQSHCEPVLRSFHLHWPAVLDCSRLPERNDRSNLCIEADTDDDGLLQAPWGGGDPHYRPPGGSGGEGPGAEIPGGLSGNAELAKLMEALRRDGKGALTHLGGYQGGQGGGGAGEGAWGGVEDLCPHRFVQMDGTQRVNSTSLACAPMCGMDVLYRAEDKRFAQIWLTVWATLSLASTTATFLTFLVAPSRFKYPERPVVFLSLCCALHAAGFLLRAAVGADVIACDHTRGPSQTPFLIQGGLESTWCIAVFLVLYFFGMASSLWWVVLTITFYLAAGRKWGREAIQRLSSYFHVAAWALPSIQTIVVLTLRRVDGEELTGVCYVGNQDPVALLGFVIAPLGVYLVVGTSFVLAGFIAMYRIRRDLKVEAGGAANVRKLEKLMAKIGVFAVLYTVPATCVVACLCYELVNMRQWRHAAMTSSCVTLTSGPQAGRLDCSLAQSIPSVEVILLKVLMLLAVGATSGMWVFSPKTAQTWRGFCARAFGGKSRPARTLGGKTNLEVGAGAPEAAKRFLPPPQLAPVQQVSMMVAQQRTNDLGGNVVHGGRTAFGVGGVRVGGYQHPVR